ncbi:collagen, type I, alpha 1b-like [Macrobrachium nipponense]|uniref:collagen, type I, alpha 1b-like n=1 Tax=Macrobrachium nipponense TaxID=159736 RepID=UPI0030C89D63
MSVTCHGTGGPGLPWVPGRAGNVRHLPWDGRAWPAVGPGAGGRCLSLATGRAGRACRGSRGGRAGDVLTCHGTGVPGLPGSREWEGWMGSGLLPIGGPGWGSVGVPGRIGNDGSVSFSNGMGRPGLPWVPGQDERCPVNLPRDGRAGLHGSLCGRAMSVPLGPRWWTGRARGLFHGSRVPGAAMVAHCQGRAERAGPGDAVTCHGTGGPGLPVGPGAGERCPSLATGRSGPACRGSPGVGAMSVTCHGTGGPGLLCFPVRGGRCPSLATGRAGRACRGSRCGRAMSVTCNGKKKKKRAGRACRGSPVRAGDVRNLPRDGRGGPGLPWVPDDGGRCPSLATGWAGLGLPWVPGAGGDVRHLPRDGPAVLVVGPGAGAMSVTLPRDGRAGSAVGPGFGRGDVRHLTTGRGRPVGPWCGWAMARTCHGNGLAGPAVGSRCGWAMPSLALGRGGPGLPWVPGGGQVNVPSLPRDGAGPGLPWVTVGGRARCPHGHWAGRAG